MYGYVGIYCCQAALDAHMWRQGGGTVEVSAGAKGMWKKIQRGTTYKHTDLTGESTDG